MAPGLCCSVACEICPNQGLNPCLLHWQADSLPLSHQGSPHEVLHRSAHPPCVPFYKAQAPGALSLQSPCAPDPKPHLGKFRRKRSEPASEPLCQSWERPYPLPCRGGSGPSCDASRPAPTLSAPVSFQRDDWDPGPGPGQHGVRGGLPWSHSLRHLQEMRAKLAALGL